MGYSSVTAATKAMHAALRRLFSPEVMAEFKSRLNSKLFAPRSAQEAELVAQLAALQARQRRLVQLASNPDIGQEPFEQALVDVTAQLESLDKQVKAQFVISLRQQQQQQQQQQRQFIFETNFLRFF